MDIAKRIVPAAVAALCACGCRSIEIQGHGNQNPKPAVDRCGLECCVGSYWGYWITRSPQQILDEWSQQTAGGPVATQGVFRVEIETNLAFDLVAAGTLGLVAPVNVRCWMQDDGKSNTLPSEVRHKRPAR